MNASGRFPSASEVLDVMVQLDRDPARRFDLQIGYKIYEACIAAGVVGPDGIDWVAQRMQELARDGLIEHGPIARGVIEPSVWDGYWIQSAHDWRITSAGRASAALVQRRAPVNDSQSGLVLSTGHDHDVFVSHASEDKDAVARPLAEALEARGWSIWLDELELTVGDSLNGTINQALSRSRFGVVVLSPAFFEKQWAMNELAGLAAREVESGTKVILPVWHQIDRAYLTTRMPILADRLGALTSAGIEDVADRLSRSLHKAQRSEAGPRRQPVVQSAQDENADTLGTIPLTKGEQNALALARPPHWEHLLFAGALLRMRDELDGKWHDHRRRLPRGDRRDCDQTTALDFLDREIQWLSRRMEAMGRLLDPSIHDATFGGPGRPGDAGRIVQLASQVIESYEAMMDWAAHLRAVSAPREWLPVFDAAAHWVDQPLTQIREYVDHVVDQVSRIPELQRQAAPDAPVTLDFVLSLSIGEDAVARLTEAMERASR